MDCIIDKNGYYCLGYDCSRCKYKGDNKMKPININEVFECKDGTEFDVESEKELKNGKRVLLKDGALVYKTYHSKVGINKNILNAKFYKIEQPKPVLFMEAIKEYRKGKTIYCILDGEKQVYKYNKGFLSDTQGMAISDIEILKGKWYIKED